MYFEIISEIDNIETIAIGGRIKDIMRLRKNMVPPNGGNLKELLRFAFRAERYAMLRFTGTKPMA